LILPAPLAATAAALRSGQIDLLTYIDKVCNRIIATDPLVHSLLPEANCRTRLRADAAALQARFPDPASRPPLYGIPVGVKDVFRVDGFPTQAGSQLPPELFAGPEASCVTLLRRQGALILGKTVSTEFAYYEPGPTRNPHNLEHTPGGSSSGSAAAVAAGFCPLALGTQTIGSTIRPAAFCGIVGFKPSYDRIPTDGLIMCSESLDTVGLFTQDNAGIALAASVLCKNWQPVEAASASLPVLGVPEGPYLAQASSQGLAAFEKQLALLEKAGYTVLRIPALLDIDEISHRHMRLVFAEMAQVHAAWFAQYEALYRPRTVAAIREGQSVPAEELAECRAGRTKLRADLESLMLQAGIDLWVCPAAPGPAPEGIDSTGSPIMNLPWTYAGMPTTTVPAGHAANGLPFGLQCVSAAMADEYLLEWLAPLTEILASSGSEVSA
jgi:Asp-tRNA(Asn)/Glu-tRNA(Gln) amidotransferase A subunit family amidase